MFLNHNIFTDKSLLQASIIKSSKNYEFAAQLKLDYIGWSHMFNSIIAKQYKSIANRTLSVDAYMPQLN